MYYAISTFGTQNSAIGVATSPTMEVGSWTDLGATGIASSTGKDYNAIDPNLIKVGNNYLFVSLFFHHSQLSQSITLMVPQLTTFLPS